MDITTTFKAADNNHVSIHGGGSKRDLLCRLCEIKLLWHIVQRHTNMADMSGSEWSWLRSICEKIGEFICASFFMVSHLADNHLEKPILADRFSTLIFKIFQFNLKHA